MQTNKSSNVRDRPTRKIIACYFSSIKKKITVWDHFDVQQISYMLLCLQHKTQRYTYCRQLSHFNTERAL